MNEQQMRRFQQMCNMHDNGYSIMQMANRFSITKQRVSQIFREQGMPLRIDASDQELLAVRDPKVIARRYGFRLISVKARMKRLGIILTKQPYTKTKFTDTCITAMIVDYRNGMKQREIAEKYNTQQGYVSKLLRQNGIKKFTRGDK